MSPHDARLVPAALAAYVAAGSLVAGWVLVAVGTVVALVVGALVASRHRGAASLTLAAVIATIVATVTAVHLGARWQGDLAHAVDSEPVLVSATMIREPVPVRTPSLDGERRVRVVLRLDAWAPACGCTQPVQDAQWRQTRATITVIAGPEWGRLTFGERVVALVDLRATRPGRDAAVAWGGEIVHTGTGTRADEAIAQLRRGLRDATAHLPPQVRGLTRGMVIGDTSDMPPEQIDAMRVTSLAHLTAVSGAHFAIVLMATFGLMRRWRWPRRLRAVLAGVVMAGFAALVFPEPSVLRALAMSVAVCAAVWWGRPAHALPALAAGVIALLVLDPFLALSYGFALSVAAVAAIVVWAPTLAERLQRWVTPALAKVISIPLAAQVACAPILVLINPGIGVYGVAANLVAVAFAVPVTLMGMLAVLTAIVSAPVAAAVASAAGLAAWPIAWVSLVLAEAPGSWITWPGGVAGALSLAVVSLTIIAATTARRFPDGWRMTAVLAVIVLVTAMPSVRQSVAPGSRTIPDWSIVVCDVGQGHMMLVRAAQNAAVVIDVGSPGHGGVECLKRHGVAHVPLLILTHPHSDHDGAVAEVSRSVSIGAAWFPAAGATPPHDRAYRELEERGVPVTITQAGDAATIGNVELEVWHPSGYMGQNNLNDASVVVSGRAGAVTFLNLGDVEEPAQQTLLARVAGGFAVDVVLVAHHGSAKQHPPFVDAIDARLAAVGVGADNRHGHPAASALELYGAGGALVLRTDKCGDVLVARREELVVSADCADLMAG
ncbi:MAG: hypothetical protein CVT64_04960 [Actinobacteria bacterium HGW-Actinobacteria-4]|nr:MAG: hypothetical protein CVT64_04960 [Actinobacteria bacterium HGW-Actinobacteria-4]